MKNNTRIIGYEVGRIRLQKEGKGTFDGVEVKFEAKETIPSNESFGKNKEEGFFTKLSNAENLWKENLKNNVSI